VLDGGQLFLAGKGADARLSSRCQQDDVLDAW
jgi:hypothetical protein